MTLSHLCIRDVSFSVSNSADSGAAAVVDNSGEDGGVGPQSLHEGSVTAGSGSFADSRDARSVISSSG